MWNRTLIIGLLSFALFSPVARAQSEVWGDSTICYDPDDGSLAVWADTYANYDTYMYYAPHTTTDLYQDGWWVASGWGDDFAFAATTANPGSTYWGRSEHELDVICQRPPPPPPDYGFYWDPWAYSSCNAFGCPGQQVDGSEFDFFMSDWCEELWIFLNPVLIAETVSDQETVAPVVSVTPGPTAILAFASGASDPQSACVDIEAAGYPAGGAFNWTTNSNKITLTGANTHKVHVCSIADQYSSSQADVSIQVVYTVSGVASSPGTTKVTVLKPTSLSLTSDTTSSTGHTCTEGSQTTGSCSQSYYHPDSPGANYLTYVRDSRLQRQ